MSEQKLNSDKNRYPCHFTETVKQCGVVFNSENVEEKCFNNFMGENVQAPQSDNKNK